MKGKTDDMNGERQIKAPVKLSFWRHAAAVIPILTTLAMMTTPVALAQVMYSVTDLGTLGGSSSWPTCINNSGQIVGYSDTTNDAATHAFLYNGGTMTDLGTLGGSDSEATCINNNRQIVGFSLTSSGWVGVSGPYHAFLYTILNTGGTMTDLDNVNPNLSGATSKASGINDNGDILGNISGGGFIDGFILYNGGSGSFTGLGDFEDAESINNSDEVVGIGQPGNDYGQFLLGGAWGYTSLPLSPVAINNNGQIVGASTNSNNAALYAGGTLAELGTLPGGTTSYPYGINNNGQVVGFSDTSSGATHAFIYTGGNMTDLNSLMLPNSGWTLVEATAISDSGYIVGQGTNSSGQSHAFLLTPIPQVPHRAAATAVVSNGLVQSAMVTDGGYGYTNPPTVLIQGGGGTGATATAVVSNGFVISITITDAGTGYTNAPSIYIYSPLGLQIGLVRAVTSSFSDLLIGTNYQLQVSGDLSNWTNQGSAFTATNPTSIYPQYWNVDNWNQLFFRLQMSP